MANTYVLISSNTLTTTATSVTFSSIPQTYTDLHLRMSIRTDNASAQSTPYLRINGVSTGTIYSRLAMGGGGTGGRTFDLETNVNQLYLRYYNGGTATANAFGVGEIYLTDYTSSSNKIVMTMNASETASSVAYMDSIAGLIRTSSAITSLAVFADGSNFVSGSSFFLYGIKNS